MPPAQRNLSLVHENYSCGWHEKDAKDARHGNELIRRNGSFEPIVKVEPGKRIGFSVEAKGDHGAIEAQIKKLLDKNRVSYETREIEIIGTSSDKQDIARITFMNIPAEHSVGLKKVIEEINMDGPKL